MLGQHIGSHIGEHLGAFAPATPAIPLRARLAIDDAIFGALAQIDVIVGALAATNVLHGRLQLAGDDDVIDIIGPVSVYQGDALDLMLIVTDDTGQAVDLTGMTIEVQVKSAIGAADPPMIAKSVGIGITLLDQNDPATTGFALCSFSSGDTNVTPQAYSIDGVVVRSGKRTHVIAPRAFNVLGVVNAP